MPKVSVLLPTYNRASLLKRAIESVKEQTYQDWELLVLDDASTDETPEVTAALAAEDPRIRVIRHPKNNYPDISKTLNDGLAIAEGEYIARLDDDDWWCDKEKLARQVEFMEKNPEYTVTGTGVIVVDGEGNERFRYLKAESDEAIRARALFANPFSHTTTVFRRDATLRVGGYGKLAYAEDWDLWLKLGEIGKLHNFPEYATKYLMAGANKSFLHQRPQARMILGIIRAHRAHYPNFWSAYLVNLGQYCYSFLPEGFRRGLHAPLSFMKRSLFTKRA